MTLVPAPWLVHISHWLLACCLGARQMPITEGQGMPGDAAAAGARGGRVAPGPGTTAARHGPRRAAAPGGCLHPGTPGGPRPPRPAPALFPGGPPGLSSWGNNRDCHEHGLARGFLLCGISGLEVRGVAAPGTPPLIPDIVGKFGTAARGAQTCLVTAQGERLAMPVARAQLRTPDTGTALPWLALATLFLALCQGLSCTRLWDAPLQPPAAALLFGPLAPELAEALATFTRLLPALLAASACLLASTLLCAGPRCLETLLFVGLCPLL